MATPGLLPERVAAVRNHVALSQARQELLEVLVDHLAVRCPHQDDARAAELDGHVSQVVDGTQAEVCSGAARRVVGVPADDVVPALHGLSR